MITPEAFRAVGLVTTAVLIGAGLAVHERLSEAPAPSPVHSPAVAPERPAAGPLRPGAHTATNVGPWYAGWELVARTLCLESTIPGIPTYFVSAELGKVGITAPVSGVTGGCAARGYKAHERVVLRDMTAAERLRFTKDGPVCAVTEVTSVYTTNEIAAVQILYLRTAPQETACGGGAEWRDIALHEVGHVVGLSHAQPYVSSALRDGHWFNPTDVALLRNNIYNAKPAREFW